MSGEARRVRWFSGLSAFGSSISHTERPIVVERGQSAFRPPGA